MVCVHAVISSCTVLAPFLQGDGLRLPGGGCVLADGEHEWEKAGVQ
jgi:hypothetical protein